MKNTIKIIVLLLLIINIFTLTPFFLSSTYAQDIEVKAERVEYQLPYPGLLSDHPLYSLKRIRDKLWIFLTRSATKKAELYFLMSDKKAVSAQLLAQNNKWEKAGDSIIRAEKDFMSAIDSLKLAKKSGVSPSEKIKNDMKLSNQKHREIIEDLIGNSPPGLRKKLEEALKNNVTITRALESSF